MSKCELVAYMHTHIIIINNIINCRILGVVLPDIQEVLSRADRLHALKALRPQHYSNCKQVTTREQSV